MESGINSSKKGKAVEHYLISELLNQGLEVYLPVVDSGIDFIVKDRNGGLIEVQVKSRSIMSDKSFFSIKDFKPRYNFFIICYNLNENIFFVIHSEIFHRHSRFIEDRGQKVRRFIYARLKNYENYKNEKGIEFIKKALSVKQNKIN